jgi:hypothetical protein
VALHDRLGCGVDIAQHRADLAPGDRTLGVKLLAPDVVTEISSCMVASRPAVAPRAARAERRAWSRTGHPIFCALNANVRIWRRRPSPIDPIRAVEAVPATPLLGAPLGAPSSMLPSPLLNVSVVAAATDIGQTPAPPRPNALIAAVVVTVRVGPGEYEEPVVEPVVPESNSGMSHAGTRK